MIRHNIIAHNVVINRLMKEGLSNEAELYLRDLEKSGLALQASTFTPLLTEAARRGDVRRAEELYARMREKKLRIDATTNNVLIMAHARARDYDGALEILRGTRQVTDGGYGSLVTELVKDRMLRVALEVLHVMHRRGHIGADVHKLVLRALIRERKLEEFKKLLEEMRAANVPVVGEVWGLLFSEVATGRASMSMQETVSLARAHGASIGSNEITEVIKGHLMQQQWTEAETRLRSMKEECGEAPSQATFAAVMEVLSMRNFTAQVPRWAELMAEFHVPPSTSIAYVVEQAHLKLGNAEQAAVWSQRAVHGDEAPRRDKLADGWMAVKLKEVLAEKGRSDWRGVRFLKARKDEGHVVKTSDWETVLDDFIERNRPDLAVQALTDMEAMGVPLSRDLRTRILSAYVVWAVSRKNFKLAEQLIRESGAAITSEAVLRLLEVYALTRQFSKALTIFHCLDSPTRDMYIRAATLLQRHGSINEAREMWSEFTAQGFEHTDESRRLEEAIKEPEKPKRRFGP